MILGYIILMVYLKEKKDWFKYYIINDINIFIWFLKYFIYKGKLKVFESLYVLVKKKKCFKLIEMNLNILLIFKCFILYVNLWVL